MSVTVKELIEKVSEENVGLWEMREFSIVFEDKNRNQLHVAKIKVDVDTKTVRIRLG